MKLQLQERGSKFRLVREHSFMRQMSILVSGLPQKGSPPRSFPSLLALQSFWSLCFELPHCRGRKSSLNLLR